jgi:hypothetical protein
MIVALRLFVMFIVLSLACWAQSSGSVQQTGTNKVREEQSAETDRNDVKQPLGLHLTPVETISAPSEAATGFGELGCDDEGNLYFGSDSPAFPGIRKLSPKGELLAVYKPDTNPDVKVEFAGDFFITQSGEVYLWVGAKDSFDRYVLIFKSDGSYKSNIKLEAGFPWMPANISVFPHGEILMTGQEFVKDAGQPMLPLTGIFSTGGKLLKELDLEDDGQITKMASAHDAHVVSAANPTNNRGVAWGRVAAANDGNIYVMRWLSPAVFYAVSPAGEVVRRFTVDPGASGYMPVQMHISGGRIAVLFVHPSTQEKVMKIVDLTGHELASYDELRADGKAKLGPLGLAFVCYAARPERFTFVTTDENHKIQLKQVEAR